MADGDSYARSNGVGGVNGFLGVRLVDGGHELRVQGNVTHLINVRETVTAEIFYEGNAPQPGHARVFFIPFMHKDGTSKYLVIPFEIDALPPAASAQTLSFEPSTKPP